MSELKDRIQQGLSQLQLASFSTLTVDGLPWTRHVMICADDDLTIRFGTFADSRKVSQINNNKEVHLTCGVLDPIEMRPYYQIQGRAEVVLDPVEKEAFWNPALASYFKASDDPDYAVVVIKPYRIELYTPPALQPEVLELESKSPEALN